MKTKFRPLARSLYLGLIVAIGLFSAAQAQSLSAEAVPAKIKASFTRSVPGTHASWRSGARGSFEAHFNRSGQPYVYVYNGAGSLLEKKIMTSRMSLPSQVKGAVEQKYSHPVIEDAFKVINRNKQKYYQVIVVNGSSKDYLNYDTRGSLVESYSEPLQSASMASSELSPSKTTPVKETVTAAATPPKSDQPVLRGASTTTTPAQTQTTTVKEEDIFSDESLYDLDDEDEFGDDLDDLLDDGDSDLDGDFDDFDILDDDDDDDDDLLDDPGFDWNW